MFNLCKKNKRMEQTIILTQKTRYNKAIELAVLFFLFFPAGAVKIWKLKRLWWLKVLYTLLGIPLFLVIYTFLGIVVFSSFLPPLDLSMGDRKDRTVVNSLDHYASTFIKTGRETNGAYELIQVAIQPGGGNGLHYHKAFEEEFTVLKGTLTVILDGKRHDLTEGQSATARRRVVHDFQNLTKTPVLIRVKVTPASGLEKSIRVSYGLMNTGQWEPNGLAKNPWHLALLLGYSGTYLPDIPSFIQEPLVNSFAKIAQWKGEDQALKVFFE